ncbi:hypothetical protein Z517_05931 [Fonsecaea pedrosoi CBS 271.37]|uniref:Uncharacterized protein n=1 Tax=Fonsecaea pedrosoi CBS 271.37 TaxID=1442368 RepID=A0A0D2H3T4_9EURO|nr:uncharacterized protein Z517_05931 [Fonsecaea pedrosoi CBS 271.37]KIW79319.1 hypothetical protein Z517_05931 [Fonsecaea pedrosoi CBS 271.37]
MAGSEEDCFCKGSIPVRKTCLLMMKLLRSMTMDFRREVFEGIAREMDTDVDSLFSLYHKICISKKLARRLGCPDAIDKRERLRRGQKKRNRERSAQRSIKREARMVSEEEQEAKDTKDAETGIDEEEAAATVTIGVPTIKEQDHEGLEAREYSGLAQYYGGSSLLDQHQRFPFEADDGELIHELDEDNLP